MLNKLQEVMQYSSSQIWLSHEIQLCLFGRNYHLLTPSSLSSSDETGHVAALQEMQKFNYASSFTLYGNAPTINQKFWRPFRKENQSYGLFFCIKGMTMCPTLCFIFFAIIVDSGLTNINLNKECNMDVDDRKCGIYSILSDYLTSKLGVTSFTKAFGSLHVFRTLWRIWVGLKNTVVGFCLTALQSRFYRFFEGHHKNR